MLVRAVDEEADCASSFAAHAEEVSSSKATCPDEIQVEHAGLARELKDLVKEFDSVFLFSLQRCLMDCHLGGTSRMLFPCTLVQSLLHNVADGCHMRKSKRCAPK